MIAYYQKENVFAHIVEDKQNKTKLKGTISIYPDREDGIVELELNDNVRFQLIRGNCERDVIFVGAESGAGKRYCYFVKSEAS